MTVQFQPHEQLGLDFVEPEVMTLDNFVVGENAALFSALRLALEGSGPQFLYIWGPEGSGKSHLASAIAGQTRDRVPRFSDKSAVYAVDDVESLDEAQSQSLFNLMNAVRRILQHALFVQDLSLRKNSV